jgi:amidase
VASFDTREATVAGISAALEQRQISVVELTESYLQRIDEIDKGPTNLRSVIEINPDAMEAARALQEELDQSGPRGPLHGMPLLIKDNIGTADGMHTTAGSLALSGSRPKTDAQVVNRLRAAGVVLLGKTNLSEWANFRSPHSTSGWSGRGGQTLNPYVLDRSPCGSSSGSAAAVAADLAIASLGSETDGSIVCPSSVCGIVGIKPTVGLTSRAGVVPIAQSQDTVGVHARSVADAAAWLQAIAEPQTGTASVTNYGPSLRHDALRGARIGVLRQQYSGYSPPSDQLFEAALLLLSSFGAVLVDPALVPSAEELEHSKAEHTVLEYEFHAGLDLYLQSRGDPNMASLADVIAFNKAHAADEMPLFGQETLEASLATGALTDDRYLQARAECLRLGVTDGLDATLGEHQLDALVALTSGPAWIIDRVNGDHHLGSSCQLAAMAGYPLVTVPLGLVAGELPVGITFMGRAYSEASLIGFAYAYEQESRARRAPRFLPTLPTL